MIDFENNTITINHTITIASIDGKKQVVAEDRTKTKSSMRTMPLVPPVKEKLLRVREQQKNVSKEV